MGLRALVVLACFISGSIACAQNAAGDSPLPSGRVRKAIENAKSNSLKEVTLIPTTALPTGITDLDEAIANHSILVVRPIAEVTTLGHPDHLMTWYKVQVEEILRKQKTLSADPLPDLPTQFLPLAPNELLLPTAGGTVKVDGITVRETYAINSLFVLNKDYLVCVDLKANRQVGTFAAGLDGVFRVGPSGSLKALGDPDHGLALDLQQRFADDLDFVRTYTKEQVR